MLLDLFGVIGILSRKTEFPIVYQVCLYVDLCVWLLLLWVVA